MVVSCRAPRGHVTSLINAPLLGSGIERTVYSPALSEGKPHNTRVGISTFERDNHDDLVVCPRARLVQVDLGLVENRTYPTAMASTALKSDRLQYIEYNRNAYILV